MRAGLRVPVCRLVGIWHWFRSARCPFLLVCGCSFVLSTGAITHLKLPQALGVLIGVWALGFSSLDNTLLQPLAKALLWQ